MQKQGIRRFVFNLCLFSVLFACPGGGGWAAGSNPDPAARLEEIVVTASRMEEPLRRAPESITLIGAREIERSGKQTVIDVLRTVPGLSIQQSGTVGGEAYIHMRGTNNAHTLILVDGVRIGDPVYFDGKISIADFPADNVERIEVVRGNQGVLYGSDAIGGVINIITKKGKGKPRWTLGAEGGSYETFRERLAFSGAWDRFDLAAAVSRLDSKGVSKADEDLGNREQDYYHDTAVSAKFNARLTDASRAGVSAVHTRSKMDYDSDALMTGNLVDADVVQNVDITTVSGHFEQDITDAWRQTVKLGLTQTKREYFRDGGLFDGRYSGRIGFASWQHNVFIADRDTVTAGFDFQHEQGDSAAPWGDLPEQIARTKSVFLQNQWTQVRNLEVTLGVRHDDHQAVGGETTYKGGAAYLVEKTGTKFRASYGTGFRAPSLYQLFDPTYGNPGLKPEKSRGWDAGIDQSLFQDRLTLNVTYFRNDLTELIVYDFTASRYKNVETAKTSGWETALSWRPLAWLGFDANYTYTETLNEMTRKEMTYRPRHMAQASVRVRPIPKLNVNLQVQYVGRRYRDDANTAEMPAYTLANAAVTYDWTDRLQLTARVDNLANVRYNTVYQYGEPRLGVYGGIKITY